MYNLLIILAATRDDVFYTVPNGLVNSQVHAEYFFIALLREHLYDFS